MMRKPREQREMNLSRRSARRKKSSRSGLTLLEILISMAIFFGSMAALSQMAWNGTRAVVQARLKSQAIIRCEAKMAEVISGVESMQAKSNIAFPDNSRWTYSIKIAPASVPELYLIEVRVAHSGGSRLANAEFLLHRFTRDPASYVAAAAIQKNGQGL